MARRHAASRAFRTSCAASWGCSSRRYILIPTWTGSSASTWRWGELVFAHARHALDNWTFAELFERRNPPDAPDHYVAFIDCRGDEKRARSFFTRWHEVAHLLVLTPRLAPPFNRDSKERCPIERLMDLIAGEIGFYQPVFRPEFEQCVARHGALSYRAIEDLRDAYCPAASFHATAIAAVRAYDRPALLVEARPALKAHEQRALDAGKTFPGGEQPRARLRAVSVFANDAAKAANLRIDWNMEVPEGSIIARAIEKGDESVVCGRENLGDWLHSDGLPPARSGDHNRGQCDAREGDCGGGGLNGIPYGRMKSVLSCPRMMPQYPCASFRNLESIRAIKDA